VILASEIMVDSENTIFYAVCAWTSYRANRRQFFEVLLEHIRFSQMRKYFLLDVVYHVAEQYKDSCEQAIRVKADLATEAQCGGFKRLLRQSANPTLFSPRPVYPNSNKFTIKCEFRNISQLELTTRYYSAPVIAHGYEFYFFLRKQKINPLGPDDNNTNLTLAGYLRCTSKILPPRHYLPIRSIVTVLMDNETERRFVPSNVIFEASEKAIGGKLTLADENWEQILNGQSPIVINNTLTAIVTVEFLDTDEGCSRIEETLL